MTLETRPDAGSDMFTRRRLLYANHGFRGQHNRSCVGMRQEKSVAFLSFALMPSWGHFFSVTQDSGERRHQAISRPTNHTRAPSVIWR